MERIGGTSHDKMFFHTSESENLFSAMCDKMVDDSNGGITVGQHLLMEGTTIQQAANCS